MKNRCGCDDDRILDALTIYSEREILAEFQESCELEAQAPGRYTGRLKLAAEDLCQMLERKNGPPRSNV
jgi:hypothetical protein